MAINPTSDIVLDVARAADPARYRAAVERLLRAQGSQGSAPAANDPALRSPGGAPESDSSWATSIESVAASDAPAASQPLASSGLRSEVHRKSDAYAQFEAFVLQSFIQEMLPKDAEHVFGKGAAGEIWKSMLAEQLATEIARGGGVGIAKSLAAAKPSETSGPMRVEHPAGGGGAFLHYLPYVGLSDLSAAGGVEGAAGSAHADRS